MRVFERDENSAAPGAAPRLAKGPHNQDTCTQLKTNQRLMPRRALNIATNRRYDDDVEASIILQWLKEDYGNGLALVHVIKKSPNIDA